MLTHTCPNGRLLLLHCVYHNQHMVPLLPHSLGYTCRANGKHRSTMNYIHTGNASTTETRANLILLYRLLLCQPWEQLWFSKYHWQRWWRWCRKGKPVNLPQQSFYEWNVEDAIFPPLKEFQCNLSKIIRVFFGRQGPSLYLQQC